MARARGGKEPSRVGTWIGRALAVAYAGGLVRFALGGSEYGTRDLLRLRGERDSVAAEVAGLQRQRDSLARMIEALRTDTAYLERLAREEHGMVRGERELLYRISRPPERAAAPDSQP